MVSLLIETLVHWGKRSVQQLDRILQMLAPDEKKCPLRDLTGPVVANHGWDVGGLEYRLAENRQRLERVAAEDDGLSGIVDHASSHDVHLHSTILLFELLDEFRKLGPVRGDGCGRAEQLNE